MTFKFYSWRDYQVDLPEGESGAWKVQRVVAEESISLLVFNMKTPGRTIAPGTVYTELTCNREVIMTDTAAEIRDHYGFFRAVRDAPRPTTVLIHGLGLGMAIRGAFLNGADHVTVVEKSEDVIRLAAPHWQERFGDKLTIIQGDAFTRKLARDERWNIVWHDVWPTLCTDNLSEMATLHRRFCRRCDWQDSWGKPLLLVKRRREQQEARRWR